MDVGTSSSKVRAIPNDLLREASLRLSVISLLGATLWLALGLISHWGPVRAGWQMSPVISWNGVITLIFAAVVPNTPRKLLIAGLLGVSMNPLSVVLAKARGSWDFSPASNVLPMHYPDYLLLGVAVVISHVLTGLGQQVAKARKMGSYEPGRAAGAGGDGRRVPGDGQERVRQAACWHRVPTAPGGRRGG